MGEATVIACPPCSAMSVIAELLCVEANEISSTETEPDEPWCDEERDLELDRERDRARATPRRWRGVEAMFLA